jgi:NAD(P)-dependent dehydrogenase (short-subunit alcohol dehydrogenase family)
MRRSAQRFFDQFVVSPIGKAPVRASHAASSFVTGTDLRVDGGFLSQTI